MEIRKIAIVMKEKKPIAALQCSMGTISAGNTPIPTKKIEEMMPKIAAIQPNTKVSLFFLKYLGRNIHNGINNIPAIESVITNIIKAIVFGTCGNGLEE